VEHAEINQSLDNYELHDNLGNIEINHHKLGSIAEHHDNTAEQDNRVEQEHHHDI